MKNMTVADIIQKLNQLPQDALVLVDGYEGGLDAVIDTKVIHILYDEKKEWYYGPYEDSENSTQVGIYLLSTRGKRH